MTTAATKRWRKKHPEVKAAERLGMPQFEIRW
jgi:hypothetical protein